MALSIPYLADKRNEKRIIAEEPNYHGFIILHAGIIAMDNRNHSVDWWNPTRRIFTHHSYYYLAFFQEDKLDSDRRLLVYGK